jgi:hypothetical protein
MRSLRVAESNSRLRCQLQPASSKAGLNADMFARKPHLSRLTSVPILRLRGRRCKRFLSFLQSNKKATHWVAFAFNGGRRRELNWVVKSLFQYVVPSSLLALCPQLCPQTSGLVGDSRTGPSAVTGAPAAAQAEWALITPAQSRALLPSLDQPWCRGQGPHRVVHCL